MQAKEGIGFGTQPGYCNTCITGVTWQSSLVMPFEMVSSLLTVIMNTINENAVVHDLPRTKFSHQKITHFDFVNSKYT